MASNLKLAPLINLSIKALTLLGKFILIFYIAKYLPPQEVGIYGLLVVIVSYSLYAVGFDFYTFSTRELLHKEKEKWGSFLKAQGYLILFTYLLFLPLILILCSYFINTKWLLFLFFLIILEHLNQELMRLLIVDKKLVWANNLLFIRSGLWCYVIIIAMYFSLIEKNLSNILYFWLISDLFSLFIGWFILKKGIYFQNNDKLQIEWIKKGLRICIPLLGSTLILRGITTLDRIWLEKLEGLEVIAAYSLFFGLANSILSFLDTGVFSFIYPKMIQENNNKNNFVKLVKKMFLQTIFLTSFISIFLIMSLPYLLNWIGKNIYYKYENIFYIILLSNIFYCIGMIPHYILYSKHQDKQIVITHIWGLCVFILSTLLFIYNNVEVAVAYGILSSFLFILFLKVVFVIWKVRFNCQ
ncbi:hypothetical protein B9X71_14020 [Acinetobacter baumannii]|uniref:oligosaccharide flippase family protein n=1 Tax=Acinetobacter baumannii TaxID=470 RepID=UPI000A332C49|nr:oligosaccharide flippase family protein [Acinetobacter baumannii]MCT9167226.1 oligosaccharide flippase family protein [Acinetobacter baumannii]MCT9174258.1 oligosaccharide flippase family protein [Acinetobacter baumannii]MCT9180970.1 oligosaccharide flippase family protein [Acinetobacter baumannii]OTK44782.1 hypothetical protein B9X71_14020 [Acinetobacter baumannii]